MPSLSVLRRAAHCTVLLLILSAAGCSTFPTPAQRTRTAERLAAKAGWKPLRLHTADFTLTAYAPARIVSVSKLTLYIGGDGLAWLTPSMPSANPTPLNPLALKLALRQGGPGVAYLARPCQYATAADWGDCAVSYWTNRRFAPEVIAATNQAIDTLKRRFHARQLVLIGYSGGGAVAALVAARRHDVARLITVAGNLDVRAWTAYHDVPALAGSLNPADAWHALQNVPQLHLVGSDDLDVPPAIAKAYASRFPLARRPRVEIIPGFTHHCCWVRHWPALLEKTVLLKVSKTHRRN